MPSHRTYYIPENRTPIMAETDESRARGDEITRPSPGNVRSAGLSRKITGTAVVFDSLSEDLGGFRERILPGAVTLAKDLKVDYDHDSSRILGSVQAGTAQVWCDNRGVHFSVTPPEAQWAADLLASMKRGDITQCSFSFRLFPGGQQITEEGGQQIRTLSRILVRRLSVVSDPAYPATSASVRARSHQPTTAVPAEAVTPLDRSARAKLMARKLDLTRGL